MRYRNLDAQGRVTDSIGLRLSGFGEILPPRAQNLQDRRKPSGRLRAPSTSSGQAPPKPGYCGLGCAGGVCAGGAVVAGGVLAGFFGAGFFLATGFFGGPLWSTNA